MSSIDRVALLPTPDMAMPLARDIGQLLFATTLFVSSFLLFPFNHCLPRWPRRNSVVIRKRSYDGASVFLNDYRTNAQVFVTARRVTDLGDLPSRPGWRRIEPKIAA
jgi:hypothetical protein